MPARSAGTPLGILAFAPAGVKYRSQAARAFAATQQVNIEMVDTLSNLLVMVTENRAEAEYERRITEPEAPTDKRAWTWMRL